MSTNKRFTYLLISSNFIIFYDLTQVKALLLNLPYKDLATSHCHTKMHDHHWSIASHNVQ